MEFLKPSYMILPDFAFLPDKDVFLGTIMRDSKDGGPDPRRPLNRASRPSIEQNLIGVQEYKDWSYNGTCSNTNKLGLWADLSTMAGIGAGCGFDFARNKNLSIQCDRMIVSSFQPDGQYIAQALDTNLVLQFIRANRFRRPWVYMVTGLMVAHGARWTVEKSNESGIAGNMSADGTGMGIPVKVGPEGSHASVETNTLTSTSAEPFILGYRLIRCREKRDGTVTDRDFNKFALWNDDDVLEATSIMDGYEVVAVEPDAEETS